MNNLFRNCPLCNSEIFYTLRSNLISAEKKKSKCKKCSSKEFSNRPEVIKKRSENFTGGKNPGSGGKIWKGRKHSLSAIEKIKKSKEQENPYFQSDEFKDKMSKVTKGEKNPMYGKSVYSVWVEKFGKEIADEKMYSYKNKISKVTSGENNPMFGKITPEGSGNGWSGWYKGWYFRSIMELSYMVNVIERFNLSWESAEKSKYRVLYVNYEEKQKTYVADFIIEGKYMVEIKPTSLRNSKNVTDKSDFAKVWCKENNLKYKITSCRKLTDQELYNMISSEIVSLTKRYKDKFDQKYKNGKQ
jgi:hypothetical protein